MPKALITQTSRDSAEVEPIVLRDNGRTRLVFRAKVVNNDNDRLRPVNGRLRETRPFMVKQQGYVVSKKSIFNRTLGDNDLERKFAEFLENCSDDEVTSYSKNYFAIGFKLDYVTADGDLSNYYPDFFVKLVDGRVFIVETKGREDVDVAPKMLRLREWCDDVNRVAGENRFDFVYVDEESFYKHRPKTFAELAEAFREFKD